MTADQRMQSGPDNGDSRNAMWIFGQFLMIPITALVYSMEMMLSSMQGLQRITSQGLEVVAGPDARSGQSLDRGVIATTGAGDFGTNNATGNNRAKTEEEKALSYDNNGNGLDKNLRDDMLKLVRYKILFVKREYEHAFPEQEDLVYDNMDGNSFTAWKVAEFVQQLQKGATPLPGKWANKNYPKEPYQKDGQLVGLPPEDKKYLRVFYQVLERFPREKFRHDERQIEVLEEIRDRMPPSK